MRAADEEAPGQSGHRGRWPGACLQEGGEGVSAPRSVSSGRGTARRKAGVQDPEEATILLNTKNKAQAVVRDQAGHRGRVSYATPRDLYFILYSPGVGGK